MLANLEVLFSSAARVEILGLFLLNPNRDFYQREIERETGQPIRAVQREVARLTEIGLLTRVTEGNRVFYCVNPGFPLLSELTRLFRKAAYGKEEHQRTSQPRGLRPEPTRVSQPFAWMETPAVAPLPSELRRIQVDGEWDRAY